MENTEVMTTMAEQAIDAAPEVAKELDLKLNNLEAIGIAVGLVGLGFGLAKLADHIKSKKAAADPEKKVKKFWNRFKKKAEEVKEEVVEAVENADFTEE